MKSHPNHSFPVFTLSISDFLGYPRSEYQCSVAKGLIDKGRSEIRAGVARNGRPSSLAQPWNNISPWLLDLELYRAHAVDH